MNGKCLTKCEPSKQKTSVNTIYTHWGKSDCSGNEIIYKGIVIEKNPVNISLEMTQILSAATNIFFYEILMLNLNKK